MAEKPEGNPMRQLTTEECNAFLISLIFVLSTMADPEQLRNALLSVSEHFDELLTARSAVSDAEDAIKRALYKKIAVPGAPKPS
jgi:hypothetical protein